MMKENGKMSNEMDRVMLLSSSKFLKQREYWVDKLSGELGTTGFCFIPGDEDAAADTREIELSIPGGAASQLLKLARNADPSIYIFILAILKALVHLYSGREDILVVSPLFRANITGDTLNNRLYIRDGVTGNNTIKELILAVRESVLKAYENQDYPSDTIIDYLLKSSPSTPVEELSHVVCLLDNIHGDYDAGEIKNELVFAFHHHEGGLSGKIIYNPGVYESYFVEQIAAHFLSVLEQSIGDLNTPVSRLQLLSPAEQEKLLHEFNDTAAPIPEYDSICAWFEAQVDRTPDKNALVTDEGALSYRQLNNKANRLGKKLRGMGIGADSIVSIMVPPCREMIVGILGILKAGGAFLPIDGEAPPERIRYMLSDSGSTILLTRNGDAGEIDFGGHIMDIAAESAGEQEEPNPEPLTRPGDMFYMIYTSGTTGKPKGVQLINNNLLNYIGWFTEKVELTQEDKSLLTSSYAFDLGYTSVFPALVTGCELHIISRDVYLSDKGILNYIHDNGITYLKITPSLFTIMLNSRYFNPEYMGTMRFILMGGEKINLKDVEKAHGICPHIAIMNHYGPTEATIGCVARFIDFSHFDEYKKHTTIGKPISNTYAYILDKHLRPLPPGTEGELCISGAGLARGYTNRPGLTMEKFIPNPFVPGERIYRTGDLAKWRPGGHIEFIGRVDLQVKIRGFRIELEEIEACLKKHAHIRDTVVVVKQDNAQQHYICAYIVQDETAGDGQAFSPQELRNFLGRELPEYMIPNYFVTIDEIPLTPNGKVNKRLLPEPDTSSQLSARTAPRSRSGKKLAAIWAEVLEMDVQDIGVYDNFFELGGHSLKVTGLVGRIHKEFDVEIPIRDVFNAPTIDGLALLVKDAEKSIFFSIEPVEKKQYYPLSSAQERLFILQQMEPGTTHYNMPEMILLEGEVDKDRFSRVFRDLIARHESLRTSFRYREGEPVQVIHDSVDFEVTFHKSHPGDAVPFDLGRAPLLRVGLVELAGNEHTPEHTPEHMLMFDMHHIISDGTSMGILIREFMALYAGETLPPLHLQYKDYSQWQRLKQVDAAVRRQEEFWVDEFSGDLPVLEIYPDFPRPVIQSFKGSTVVFEIDDDDTGRMKALAADREATPFMFLLAVCNILVSKLGGQEDIILGSPVEGRRHENLGHILGMFVNMLPLRNYPAGDKTFEQFLAEVRERTLLAYDNQDVQFEDLVDKVMVRRDPSRNPLFDVVFTLQKAAVSEFEIPGLKVKPYEGDNKVSKFDLAFIGSETGGKTVFLLNYCTDLFERETIERFTRIFNRILQAVTDDPAVRLADIPLISSGEKQRILEEFNNTRREYPGEKTISRLFREQVERVPGNTAVIHEDENGETVELTYRQLDRLSNRWAALLIEKGTRPGDIVAIMTTHSTHMAVGVLAILKAGGAYLAVDPGYPEDRQNYMLRDSSVELLLAGVEVTASMTPEIIHMIDTEPPETDGPIDVPMPDNPLAYVIYTSGSTGKPKAVMVEHRNVVRLVKNTRFIRFPEDDRILQTGALEFDASTFEIWGALLNGSGLVLVGKEIFLAPDALKERIRKYRVRTMWLTAALFNQLVQADVEIFDGLRNLVVGGDVLSPPHIEIVRQRFPELDIINGYGPTENTTFSVTHLIKREYAAGIPIGRPITNSTAYIADANGHLQPVGVVGELLVGGDGVARGYLNRPELTAGKFIPDFTREDGESMLYKTGDLARWRPDGVIQFLGRIDNQIKIRGYRVELGEIEHRLTAHPAIRDAVVVFRDKTGTETSGNQKQEKYIAAYYIVDETQTTPPDASDLKSFLSGKLPDYMIPSYLVPMDAFPLTPNGKIDRRALPEPGKGGEADYVAPRDEVESRLVGIWSGVLGIPAQTIGIETNFFELGGHSLKATNIIAAIHKAFNVKIPLVDIFTGPTVKDLATSINNAVESRFDIIEPAPEKEYYTLSSAQKRLFVIQQMDHSGTSYNIPAAFILRGEADIDKIEDVFRRLVERHESLRTSFETIDGQPVQKINASAPFAISRHESHGDLPAERIQGVMREFVRPFDLAGAPLFRVGIARLNPDEYLLAVDMHHIISDGTSMGVLIRDFSALYREQEPEPLRIHYKDYSEWQQGEKSRAALEAQAQYWRSQFSGDIPVLELPTDSPRPPVQQFAGNHIDFSIDAEAADALKALAAQEGGTLFMVLLALFNVLLAKLSRQEDIVVGTAVAGRRHADLHKIIGMFVNTLALRNRPAGEKLLPEFIREVRDNTFAAFENQEFQFEDLLDEVAVEREMSRNPLFDVIFTLRNVDMPEIDLPGFTLTPQPYETKISKLDMILTGIESTAGIDFNLEYSTLLFREETAERIILYFKRIITHVAGNPGCRIQDIELASEEEKQQILHDFNDTGSEYPRDESVPQLFSRQAALTPDRDCVVYEGQTLTYRQVEEKSNRLAGLLISRGIRPEDSVAVMTETSPAMVIAVLAILKAGGAYVPVNPGYPRERKEYILSDSRARVLLTDQSDHGFHDRMVISLTDPAIYAHEEATAVPTRFDNLAYIIYTSGSTGIPKGVMVEHRNIVRLVKNNRFIDLRVGDRILQTGALEFDASTFEIWGALLNGLTLYLAPKEKILVAETLKETISRRGITVMWLTAPLFNRLSDDDIHVFAGLRVLVVGGDTLSPPHISRLREHYPGIHIINGYGPTENTTFSNTHLIRETGLHRIPIGRPISNSTAYILDRSNRLQPVGVPGELCVGGDGVARGYLNDARLTEQKFIPDPFVPGQRLYKTGDLASWLPGGVVDFLGRMDNQVKIRGFRVELGEIETRLSAIEGIRESMVMVRQDKNGEKYICAYYIPHTQDGARDGANALTPAEVKAGLAGKLPAYMIPSYFVALEEFPLNANGKIDRKALPVPGEETGDGSERTLPRDEVEEKLAAMWAGVLETRQQIIGIDDDFFELGGHSLKATTLISDIHREFNVKVPLSAIFEAPTIREISRVIARERRQSYHSIQPVEEKQYYPLSSAQNRLYTIQQVDTSLTHYNMPIVLELEGNLDRHRLEDVFHQLTERHESLRTAFTVINKEPVQRIFNHVAFSLEYVPINGDVPELHRAIQEFIRPFNLEQPPLMRVRLLQTGADRHILMLDMHHIITDGVSMRVFLNDFTALYSGGDIPHQPLRYRDFSSWQEREMERGILEKQESYWLKQFQAPLPVLELPTDFSRPGTQSNAGGKIGFILEKADADVLKEIAAAEGATLFVVLMAVYTILLAKLSGQEDIVVGTPVACRRHAQLDNTVGVFVNTLALRYFPNKEKTLREFLKEVKTDTLDAFENQEYPFEELVKKVVKQRDVSRNPLFDTVLVLQNLDLPEWNLEGLTIRTLDYEPGNSKFDLTFHATEQGDQLILSFQYCSDLFKRDTVERFIEYYRTIVSQLKENIDNPLEDIKIAHRLYQQKLIVPQDDHDDFGF